MLTNPNGLQAVETPQNEMNSKGVGITESLKRCVSVCVLEAGVKQVAS